MLINQILNALNGTKTNQFGSDTTVGENRINLDAEVLSVTVHAYKNTNPC